MLIGVAALLLLAPQTYDLMWRPKLKEAHAYSLDVAFDYSDGSLANIQGTSKVLVVRLNPDRSYTLESSSSGMKTIAQGQTESVPDAPSTREEFDRFGIPLKEEKDSDPGDSFSNLLDRLSVFQAPIGPVEIGYTWISKIKPGRGFPPRIAYRFASIAKFQGKQVERVTYVASDAPGESTATGTVLLDFTTHALVQLIVNVPHFRPDPTGPSATVTVHLTEKPGT